MNERVHDVIHRLLFMHQTNEAPTRSPPPQFGGADEQFLDYKMSMMDKSRAAYENPKGWHADGARFTILNVFKWNGYMELLEISALYYFNGACLVCMVIYVAMPYVRTSYILHYFCILFHSPSELNKDF